MIESDQTHHDAPKRTVIGDDDDTLQRHRRPKVVLETSTPMHNKCKFDVTPRTMYRDDGRNMVASRPVLIPACNVPQLMGKLISTLFLHESTVSRKRTRDMALASSEGIVQTSTAVEGGISCRIGDGAAAVQTVVYPVITFLYENSSNMSVSCACHLCGRSN